LRAGFDLDTRWSNDERFLSVDSETAPHQPSQDSLRPDRFGSGIFSAVNISTACRVVV
jgi:hypothetical protein